MGFKLPEPPESLQGKPVRAWSAPVVIPTYEPVPADKNPMFLEKRVYQGSSGKVYPLPFIDRISTTKTDRAWQAIHIENEYVRLMILPELGGRIHVGLDKTNGYDFFYRQNVIKPALVGLAGPWISGGVEFNWPQHHRPSTFMPVDTHIEEHADGSVTVWCSEHEPITRMKGMHGIHLKPGSSLIELKVRLYNRTELPQTFLWWANVAARVHEHYQSFFPPDVQYVADHAKRALSRFPLCEGKYYGVDYAARAAEPSSPSPSRTPSLSPSAHDARFPIRFPPANYPPNDLTRYANIPVPTSYMILGTKEDFFGGYDHHAQAGFVHVADHHIAPGKKQWTWGNHPFGYAWDRHLTDPEDPTDTAPPYRRHLPAPYIELMAGVFTDNQPDFSWLMPGETRTFSQFWYPIQKIGPAQKANIQAALSMNCVDTSSHNLIGGEAATVDSGNRKVAVADMPISGGAMPRHLDKANVAKSVSIGAVATSSIKNAKLRLHHKLDLFVEESLDLSPNGPFVTTITLPEAADWTNLRLTLSDDHGHEILAYQPATPAKKEIPEPAKEPPLPQDVQTLEELYLIGLHLEQYRHATRLPEDYWREALRRDPHDSRCNNALGLWCLRRGEFDKAVPHFQTAIATLTKYNPNPRDGEPYYNLGIVLHFLNRTDEAMDALSKAAWNAAWQIPAFTALAQIALARRQYAAAAGYLHKCFHPGKHSTLILQSLVNRKLAGETATPSDPGGLLKTLLYIDATNNVAQFLLNGRCPSDEDTRLDIAIDFMRCGIYDRAIAILQPPVPDSPITNYQFPMTTSPLTHYYLAYFYEKLNNPAAAAAARRAAALAPPDYCFPHRLEEIAILQSAIDKKPDDARAPYYLGNLFYDKRRHEEAIALWEKSAKLDRTFPTVWRNLGIAYYNIVHDKDAAKGAYQRAFKLGLTQPADSEGEGEAESPEASSVTGGDARVLYERDQLWKRTGELPQKRLEELEHYLHLVEQRDDLTLEYCSLLNQAQQHDAALQILKARNFQPWEGGEGLALTQWTRAHLALGRIALWRAPTDGGNPAKALELFHAALHPPENLGEAFHLLQNNSELHYWSGLAAKTAGNANLAAQHFEIAAASVGDFQRMAVSTYSEASFWAGMALIELRRSAEARVLLEAMLTHADHLKKTPAKIDYFATSLPTMLIFDEDIQHRQLQQATLIEALARYGLDGGSGADKKTARRLLNDLLLADPNHPLAADLLLALDWTL